MGWYQRRVHGESPVESASGRMSSLALTLSSLFALTLAAPTPQELTVRVGDSAEGVEEPGLVVVVDSSDGGPLDFGGLGGFGDFGRFPGFNHQQFSGFGDFPSRLPASFGFDDESTPEISIDLSDIFGRRPSSDGSRVPGIINTLFDALGGHLGVQVDSEGGEGRVGLLVTVSTTLTTPPLTRRSCLTALLSVSTGPQSRTRMRTETLSSFQVPSIMFSKREVRRRRRGLKRRFLL